MSQSRYDYPFDPGKQNNTPASVYRLAVSGGERVLDLGSGPGVVSTHLQAKAGKSVTCVDNDKELLRLAGERGVGKTMVADLNDERWSQRLGGDRFDVVILADVLEHLLDPGRMLAELYESPLLAPGGYLVVSIPNAAHEGALAELVTGHLTYRPTGLLDETHIRFFTLDSFRRLAEANGFLVTHIERTVRTLEQTEFKERLREIPDGFREMLRTHSSEATTYQYVMRLVPAEEPAIVEEKTARIDQLAAELAAVSEQLGDAEAEIAARTTESAELAASHRAEIDALNARWEGEVRELRSGQVSRLRELDRRRQELARSLGKDLGNEKAARKELQRQVRGLERRIQLIYDSRTWRTGEGIRRLARPFRLSKRAREA